MRGFNAKENNVTLFPPFFLFFQNFSFLSLSFPLNSLLEIKKEGESVPFGWIRANCLQNTPSPRSVGHGAFSLKRQGRRGKRKEGRREEGLREK